MEHTFQKTFEIKNDEDPLKYFNIFKDIKKICDEGNIEFNYNNGKVFIAGKKIIYQTKEGKKIIFLKGSRIIYFTNEKTNFDRKEFFIHDQESLDNALQKTEIKNGILKFININKENKSFDSDNSVSSLGSANQINKDNINSDSSNSKHSGVSDSSVTSLNHLSIEEILLTSYNLIEEPKEIKLTKIFTQQRFDTRYFFNTISDLDFNYKYVKKDYIKN